MARRLRPISDALDGDGADALPASSFKCIIVDGVKAYFGSANLTGAGMGAKSEKKRNFENGVLTDDPVLIEPLIEQFDSVWRGAFCKECGRRDFCSDPVV